ncbi:MAG: bifunctional 5,10-methylenetetrahydrofolate dehydrogenase/5,10-methenyltetrahydrofolate cyclohydrolase [Myxococcaceae bacterium]|nr:bifunctional 5,10-methylenetetrahydrofolate dehydrogenase/5,10-methenyltetrahydrofolate cyclohydrolase [Myxococcaceae bacterium]
MFGRILDGKRIAEFHLLELKSRIGSAPQKPCLCVIRVGNNPASEVYVARKVKAALAVGIESRSIHLSESSSQADLIQEISLANQDSSIHGILVQLPLPSHLSTQTILQSINPLKDVDGFHPENFGLLSLGAPRFVPCTPKGCLELLKAIPVDLLGKHAVVVGRSNIVGKPMAQLLLNSQATVTVCHKNTLNLAYFTSQADVLIVASGVPGLIGPNHVKEGAIVLDVGINRLSDGKLVGDVHTEQVLPKVSWITPVPGGVGPMTVAMLMENTFRASQL